MITKELKKELVKKGNEISTESVFIKAEMKNISLDKFQDMFNDLLWTEPSVGFDDEDICNNYVFSLIKGGVSFNWLTNLDSFYKGCLFSLWKPEDILKDLFET